MLVQKHSFKLLETYGDPETALQNIDYLAKKGGFLGDKLIPPKQAIEKEIAETKKYGADIILACEQNYPRSLLHIPDFPPIIIARGNTQLLNVPIFAIIGARNSSIDGNELLFEFAKEISNAGFTIVSGLAKGIGSYAHKEAVEIQRIIS